MKQRNIQLLQKEKVENINDNLKQTIKSDYKLPPKNYQITALQLILICYFIFQIVQFYVGFKQRFIDMMILTFHGLLNFIIFSLTFLAIYYEKKQWNIAFHFGYKRVATLITFANCLFLIFLNVFQIINSLHNYVEQKLAKPQSLTYLTFNLTVSLLGMIIFREYRTFIPIQEMQFSENLKCSTVPTGKKEELLVSKDYIEQKLILLFNEGKYLEFMKTYIYFIKTFIQKQMTKLFMINEKQQFINQKCKEHYEDLHIVFLHFWINFVQVVFKIISFYFQLNRYPFIAIAFSMIIFLITLIFYYEITQSSFSILSQQVPFHNKKIIINIIKYIENLKGIDKLTKINIWGLTTNYLVCTLKIRVKDLKERSVILQQIKEKYEKNFSELYIQIDPLCN